jgi:hypothetical protein
MMALHQVLPGEPNAPLPPRTITENAADAAGAGEAMDNMDEGGRKATALAAHFTCRLWPVTNPRARQRRCAAPRQVA